MVWWCSTIWGETTRAQNVPIVGDDRGSPARARKGEAGQGDEKHNVHASRDWGCTKQGGKKSDQHGLCLDVVRKRVTATRCEYGST